MEDNESSLLRRYVKRQTTPEEDAAVESWYANWNEADRVKLTVGQLTSAEEKMRAKVFEASVVKPKLQRQRVYMAAASILVVIAAAVLFTLISKPARKELAQIAIRPGTEQATLTISNGTKITLTGAAAVKIAVQGNMSVHKLAGGKLIYITDQKLKNTATQYNTLSTSKGGKFDLILADQTHVWLDAASSITYPVAFNGKNRIVSISGQVYFEVAHDKDSPFSVNVKGQTVQVLGTHFNIMAYDEEGPVRTTLLQGAVKVAKCTVIKF